MEDYEIENAKEWDLNYKPRIQTRPATARDTPETQTEQKHKQQHQQQEDLLTGWKTASGARRTKYFARSRPPPKLIDDTDNDGEIAFRNEERPGGSVDIPLQILDLVHDASEEIAALAKRYGAYVAVQQTQNVSDLKAVRFVVNLYGGQASVLEARQAIRDWVSANTPSKATTGRSQFAKIASLTPTLRVRAQKRWEREVIKHLYRNYPPFGCTFGAVGSFYWPLQECNPLDVLGPQLEALDSIRMERNCYVVWYHEQKVINVMGDAWQVQKALASIRKTFFQVAARQIQGVRAYLLDWTNASKLPTHVRLEKVEIATIQSPSSALAPLPGYTPRAEGLSRDKSFIDSAAPSTTLSLKRIKDTISTTIRKLHYYRGFLRLRIRYGLFLADTFMRADNDKYTIVDFEEMVQQSQFQGHLSPHIGNIESELNALTLLREASRFLLPKGVIAETLYEVEPSYIVAFTFSDKSGDLMLAVERKPPHGAGAEAEFEQVSTRWIRLPLADADTSKLIDIALLNLPSNSAWQFDLYGYQAVDETKLAPELKRFAEKLHFDKEAVLGHSTTKAFATSTPCSSLRSLRQEVVYRFDIKDADYVLELSRSQTWDYPVPQSLVRKVQPTIYKPRWAVNVFRDEWDSWLAKNEALKIGEGTDVTDDLKRWFPAGFSSASDADGFKELIERLHTIEKIIKSPIGDLMAGMSDMNVG